jgi:hypothetical protein
MVSPDPSFTLYVTFLFISHIVCSRFLCFGGSIVLLFAPMEIIRSCSEIWNVLLSLDCGVVISSKESTVLFPIKERRELKLSSKAKKLRSVGE